MRRIRGIRALLAGVTLIAASITPAVMATPAAHANVDDDVCSIDATLNFYPALTLNQQVQTMTLTDATAFDCTNSEYTGGIFTLNSGQGSSICLVLNVSGNGQLAWNNGQTSYFDYTVSTNPISGTVGLEATITSGPFQGDTIQDVPILVSISGTCATTGVTSLTLDPGELLFTSL
jgi:hypothetical protein